MISGGEQRGRRARLKRKYFTAEHYVVSVLPGNVRMYYFSKKKSIPISEKLSYIFYKSLKQDVSNKPDKGHFNILQI